MIRTEQEHIKASTRLSELKVSLKDQRERLKVSGMEGDELEEALEPLSSLVRGLQKDMNYYNDALSGQVGSAYGLEELGRLLVQARLAGGLTVKDAAEAAGMDPAYLGSHEMGGFTKMSLGRIQRLVESLGGRLVVHMEMEGDGEGEHGG